MIRTRDLVLYVLVLVFLLTGIGFTIALERDTDAGTLSSFVAFKAADSTEVTGAATSAGINREENIRSLREKLARGDGAILQGPPVFTSVDTPEENEDGSHENLDALLPSQERSPQYCTALGGYTALVAVWPKDGVELQIVEGARMFTIEVAEKSTTSTSTVATTTVRMQLPFAPVRGFSTNCLPDTVIGVALDGSLIKNDETWRFRNVSSESVLGYAFDGFPIYGQGIDESLLDSCGGYDSGVGYRYHLREKELFVLGCFAATPQKPIF